MRETGRSRVWLSFVAPLWHGRLARACGARRGRSPAWPRRPCHVDAGHKRESPPAIPCAPLFLAPPVLRGRAGEGAIGRAGCPQRRRTRLTTLYADPLRRGSGCLTDKQCLGSLRTRRRSLSLKNRLKTRFRVTIRLNAASGTEFALIPGVAVAVTVTGEQSPNELSAVGSHGQYRPQAVCGRYAAWGFRSRGRSTRSRPNLHQN
jgi:hypothetical protein